MARATAPIDIIREKAVNEEVDYNLVLSCLQNYKSPRDVISRLLDQKELIRVKKGLYVFGKRHRQRLISLEVLANQIYGPSYISREYALHYYGLIPEGVHEITSMTTKKNKHFDTPLGQFSYQHLALSKFPIGVTLKRFSQFHCALMATPEKALADFIYCRKEVITTSQELIKVLIEDFRIEKEALSKLNLHLMRNIAKEYKSPTINLLPLSIQEIQYE